jgi:two-component system, OmpR family, response regulator VicR
MSNAKILVVDDDKNLLEVLRYNLVREGYETILCENGADALEAARTMKPDLMILDIMLPGMNGLEVCRIVRKEMSIPILMLTARTEEVDKIVGLEVGADDYITKPFHVRELIARVNASIRRTRWQNTAQPDQAQDRPGKLSFGNLEINISSHQVNRNGQPVKLTPREFRLLAFLMQHPGQVFNRENLVDKVWGFDYEGGSRTVDVHIRSLRQRIEDNPESPKHILTVHGFGYKFE